MEIDIAKESHTNLTYKNNSDFDLSVNVTKAGVAYDMSGKTVRMMIKKNRTHQTAVYTLVSGTDITIATANLTWSKTMSLPNDLYYYDVYNVSDSDYIMSGLIKVLRNITV